MKPVAVAIVVAVFALASPARAQTVANLTPAFHPGPYSTLSVSPTDPTHMAIGMPDGQVLVTTDGGLSSRESLAIAPRQLLLASMRGSGARSRYANPQRERGGDRLFLSLMMTGMPLTRWAYWLAFMDPPTDVLDLAWPANGNQLLMASSSGIYLSTPDGDGWTRTFGVRGPKTKDPIGLSVAIDPDDAKHVIAGTLDGVMVSRNGGYTFERHTDRGFMEEAVNHWVWPAHSKTLFALTADTVWRSDDSGENFSAAYSADGTIASVELTPTGAMVATSKGLVVVGSDGAPEIKFKDQNVVGAVPVGEGRALVATDDALSLLTPDGEPITIRRTITSDPFVALHGHSGVVWAITKYSVLRIGIPLERSPERMLAPRMTMTMQDVEQAAQEYVGVAKPERTRLYDRWFSHLFPRVSVRVGGVLEHEYSLATDGTLGPNFATARAAAKSACCGQLPGESGGAIVMATWDLANLFTNARASNPNSIIEQFVRGSRETIQTEVRWRYRECANLVALLQHPPSDEKTRFLWQTRLEEYAAYLNVMSGREVVAMELAEE